MANEQVTAAKAALSQIPRINSLERNLNCLAEVVANFGSRFCLYEHARGRKHLGIVTKTGIKRVDNKPDVHLADIVVFNADWSGGSDHLLEIPLRDDVIDEDLPEDEQDLAGTWEPLFILDTILEAAEKAEKSDKEKLRDLEKLVAKQAKELEELKANSGEPETPAEKGEGADDETSPDGPATS